MGFSKLNIWLRDEKCRHFKIQTDTPQWDWVKIRNCMGEEIKHVVMPMGEAHVAVEVPPGCYKCLTA